MLVSAAAWALSSALQVAVTATQESGSVEEGEGATATLGGVVGEGVEEGVDDAVDAGDGELGAVGVGAGEIGAVGVGAGDTGHAFGGKDVGHPCAALHWVTSFLQPL